VKSATLLLFLAGTSGAALGDRIERRLPLAEGSELEIRLPAGELTVHCGAAGSLVVTVDRGGPDGAAVQLSVDATPRGARVEIKGGGPRRDAGLKIDVQAPRSLDVTVESTAGAIRIGGAARRVRGSTMAGPLTVADFEGRVELSTMAGELRVERSRVEGRLSTTAGRASALEVRGTGDGLALSAQGDVRLAEVRGRVSLSTTGGNVTLESVAGSIDAATAAGDVDASIFAGASEGRLRLQSEDGDVRVRVPANLTADLGVDVELAYTRNSRRSYRITGDLPMRVEEPAGWEPAPGGPRKVIRARAPHGAGPLSVVVRAVNGDVHLATSPAPPRVGALAPPLRLDTWLAGAPVPGLERGKVYVVDIWAPWCGPCVGGMRHLSDLAKRYRDRGLVVVGMTGPDDYGSTRTAAEKVVREKRPAYSVAWDEGRRNYGVWMAVEKTQGWPFSFIVDRDGRVAFSGHPEKMEAALEKVLGVSAARP
jgi:thiol-disulfide isomerase/thioredoxin